MTNVENLVLLLVFVVGILKIEAIPLGAALLVIVFLRKKKTKR
jgi:hypothetical protein